jgi:hypothetical protein
MQLMKTGDDNLLGNQVTMRRGAEKRFNNPVFRSGGGGKFI